MPYGDGTGPMGTGSGRGHGYRHWFHATSLPGWLRDRRICYPHPGVSGDERPMGDADLEHLRGVARNLEETLKWIEKRISDLESSAETVEN